jgi:RNA polymerase sigma-70 factor (ECF subfamily)
MATEGEVELELEALLRAGSFDRAATRALEAYGAEVYGFLVNLAGSDADAADVYSQLCEDLWKGLPSFGHRSSVRTWLYVLARHAAARFRRSPWNHRGRRTGDARLDDFVAESRSRTQPWLRTETKDRFAVLRDSLDQDERALLVLRVDRGLSWPEIARVMLDEGEPNEATLKREVDRLAKRFQLIKEDLRRRALEAGLLNDQR